MRTFLLVSLLFTPFVVFAQQVRTFENLVGVITGIIQTLVVVIFSLTFIVLIWTVTKTWILGGGDENDVEKGKQTVTVGIIVLVVMSGIWGIVALLRSGLFGL